MGDLTANFDRKDYVCPCDSCKNGGIVVMPAIYNFVQKMRDVIAAPLVVTCGVRCIPHNAKIGGAPDSRHTYRDAVDLEVKDSRHRALIVGAALETFPLGMVEVCPNHLHIDMRPESMRLILGPDK